jgi:dTDP-glucose pyrophosphorylase
MMPLNGKPVIDWILEACAGSVEEVVVVCGALPDIEEWCAERWPGVKCVKQGALLGPKHAISCGVNALEDPSRPLVVWLGDTVIELGENALGGDWILVEPVEDASQWCVISGGGFLDKPQAGGKGLALVGVYSFTDGAAAKRAFDEEGQEISEALRSYGRELNPARPAAWYDIGTLANYHHARGELLGRKSRAFHSVSYDPELGTVTKRANTGDSRAAGAIEAEGAWYSSLPREASLYCPRWWYEGGALTMEFCSGGPLSDLWNWGNVGRSGWDWILGKMLRIRERSFNGPVDPSFSAKFRDLSRAMWMSKTQNRLEMSGFSEEEKKRLEELAWSCFVHSRPRAGMHGDLHLGNIIYDPSSDAVKFIDPRGDWGGHLGWYGCDLYDWSKLAHDLALGYSSICAGRKNHQWGKDLMIDLASESGFPIDVVLSGGVVLMASCIPLHEDSPERQESFRAAVREGLTWFQ